MPKRKKGRRTAFTRKKQHRTPLDHQAPNSKQGTKQTGALKDDADYASDNDKMAPPPTLPAQNYQHNELKFRQATASIYLHVLGRPDKSEWFVKNGTVTKIQDMLGIGTGRNKRRAILAVLEECIALEDASSYDPKRKSHERKKGWAVNSDGFEGQLLADFLEGSTGDFCGARDVLNIQRDAEGKENVSLSTVFRHVTKKMEKNKAKTEKVSQGSTNPYSPWARARFNFNKQLAIRFGVLDPHKTPDPPMPSPPPGTDPKWITDHAFALACETETLEQMKAEAANAQDQKNILLPQFDPAKLTPIARDQRADWDETHLIQGCFPARYKIQKGIKVFTRCGSAATSYYP